MVKNREELLQVANSNASQLKNHLRKAVSDFLRVQNVKPEELAYVLGITNGEMAQILEGDVNVTVDTLSKLLVATDLVVEIKPIRNTPLGGYGRTMPRSGGYPGPGGMPVPTDENGRPLPPPPGFPPFPGGFGPRGPQREERAADRQEIPMETTRKPARNARGQFVKKSATERPVATQQERQPEGNKYAAMPDVELIGLIRGNLWDGEIDTDRATHQQLVEFLTNKENLMIQREAEKNRPQAPQAPRAETPHVGGDSNSSLNQFLGMLANIAKEAKDNPQLMDTISRFMPK